MLQTCHQHATYMSQTCHSRVRYFEFLYCLVRDTLVYQYRRGDGDSKADFVGCTNDLFFIFHFVLHEIEFKTDKKPENRATEG